MRGRAVLIFLVACSTPSPRAPAAPSYLTSVEHRRALLERSLVNRDNAYARLRLAHYGEDWERLPEWNPKVAAYDFEEAPHASRSLAVDAPLRALGEEAFFRYPVQIVPALAAVPSRADAVGYGLRDIVRVDLEDGARALAVTCATCHARRDVVGAANDRLDFGRMLASGAPSDADRARLSWGPGRLDVTTTRGDEVVRIPDLRPVRHLTHLHHAATLAAGDVETLAVRIETLIVTSHGATVRPPRPVALGLATYLFALADTLPSRAPSTDEERRGQALFEARCAGCHAPPSFSGPPIAAEEVGTDPTSARSPDRGTGRYRVPSLRGVSTRGPLLHDGTLPDLEALFDPTRTHSDYRGLHGTHAVVGHVYGLDLDAGSRRALLAYLRTL